MTTLTIEFLYNGHYRVLTACFKKDMTLSTAQANQATDIIDDPEACAEWDRMRLAKVDEEWSQSEHIANVSTTQVLRDWMEMHPEIRSAIRTEIDSLNSRREEYARQKHEKLLVWVREHFAGKTEEEWERIARAIERKQGL